MQEYAKDLNATQAAVRAGYSSTSANVTGCRLLANAKVRAEIANLVAKIAAKNEITVERTHREIARLAFGDIRKLFDEQNRLRSLSELDDDSAAMVAGLESFEEYEGTGADRVATGMVRKLKVWDKGRALDMCMSLLGLHKTGPVTGNGGLNLTINLSVGTQIKV